MEIKKFIYGIIIVFIIFLFISLPSIFFQFKAGEYSNAQNSALIQINSDECVVQQVSAGIQKWELGYEVIKQIRPKIVVTGPGTANNYSGDFFFYDKLCSWSVYFEFKKFNKTKFRF